MLEDINNKDKENIENLKKKNKFLKELELSIIAKKNIISTEAYNKEVEDFKKNLLNFLAKKIKLLMNLIISRKMNWKIFSKK